MKKTKKQQKWEDKKNITQKRKKQQPKSNGTKNTIGETKSVLIKKQEKDIKNQKINSGIYKITNTINGIFYIGSALNFKDRWSGRYNKYLERAWNKYGKENFTFEVIEYVENLDMLIEREQYYLDTLLFAQEYIRKENNKFKESGYNICPIAGNSLHYKHTKETKKIIKAKRKLQIITEQTKKKLSDIFLGVKQNNHDSSKYIGVSHIKKSNRWIAQIGYNGKSIHVGHFYLEIDAAVAYNQKAIELYGNKAKLNNILNWENHIFFTLTYTSKYIGVSYKEKIDRWITRIFHKNKGLYIGCFKTEVEAAKAYNKYIIEHKLNKKLNII